MPKRTLLLAALVAACSLPQIVRAAGADDYHLRFLRPEATLVANYETYPGPQPSADLDQPQHMFASFGDDPAPESDSALGDLSDCCGHDGCCDDDCCGRSCCGSGCGGCCGRSCCSYYHHRRILFGLVAPTDMAFNNFVSPISNPLFFEDPRSLTEIKPIFVEHAFPNANPVLQGGDAQLYAVQFRARLTDRLSLIATRDLWLDINSPGLGNREGWMDLGLGFKYNFLRRPESQTLASVGVTYDIPLGSDQVFQGNGDGDWHFFASGATQVLDNLYWMSGAGFRIPNNHHVGSQLFYWSNSFQYKLLGGRCYGTGLWALWEINWFHYMRSGNAYPFNFDGLDVINFGSADVAGQDVVTMAWGPKWKPTPLQELGVGIEIPVTKREDILNHRVYVEWSIRY